MRVAIRDPHSLWSQAVLHCVKAAKTPDNNLATTELMNEADVVLVRHERDAGEIVQLHNARVVWIESIGGHRIETLSALQANLIAPTRQAGQRRQSWQPPTISLPAPSPQERNVLIHISAGLTTNQIAEVLEISPHTVLGHRRRLFKRWGVHNALDAIRVGTENGVLPDGIDR
jgi:DNA-binding NarL/FixJ family response regulator